jgi:hypothetical protein
MKSMRKAIAVVIALGTTLGAAGCTPDTTRGRMEQDFAQTFVNQYAQSLQRQGKPVTRPRVTSTECHNGSNQKQDSGPGSWGCEIKYVTPDGKAHDDNWLALSDALGCYQAFTQDDALRYHRIVDVHTHQTVLDPAGGFDGCLDVYKGSTKVSKSP